MLTGSVSRGVADEISDIEMLIVTPEPLELAACFDHARPLRGSKSSIPGASRAGRPSVFPAGVRACLSSSSGGRASTRSPTVDAILLGGPSSAADAIANGLPLRTSGSLSRWQARLGDYPEELARAQIEDAALTWGGFAPEGLLTIARPGERLSRLERMVDDASRVLQIVYALNRVWQPTHKRLAARVAPLAVKPDRLAGRIEERSLGARPAARAARPDRAAIRHRRSRAGWPEREPGAPLAGRGSRCASLLRRSDLGGFLRGLGRELRFGLVLVLPADQV